MHSEFLLRILTTYHFTTIMEQVKNNLSAFLSRAAIPMTINELNVAYLHVFGTVIPKW